MTIDYTAARRRLIHENLCRIAQEGGIPPKRCDVGWMRDVVIQLEEGGISVEQSLILGAFLVGSAQAAVREQAASN